MNAMVPSQTGAPKVKFAAMRLITARQEERFTR